MKDYSLTTLYAEVNKSLASNNPTRACSLYGLYLAEGGKKDFKQLTVYKEKFLIVMGYKVYYTILSHLKRQNSRDNKVQNIELKKLLSDTYASEDVHGLARKYGMLYDKEVKIQSNFCGNNIVTLIILTTATEVSQGRVTKSGLTPINVTVALSHKNLLHEIALSHAVAICNRISPNCISREVFQTFLINLDAY